MLNGCLVVPQPEEAAAAAARQKTSHVGRMSASPGTQRFREIESAQPALLVKSLQTERSLDKKGRPGPGAPYGTEQALFTYRWGAAANRVIWIEASRVIRSHGSP